MTIAVPSFIGILTIFLFLCLYLVDAYPTYTMVGIFASTTMTASQTITDAWSHIICQDVNTSGCYYLTTGNLAVQVLSIAGIVVVAVKVLLARLTT